MRTNSKPNHRLGKDFAITLFTAMLLAIMFPTVSQASTTSVLGALQPMNLEGNNPEIEPFLTVEGDGGIAKLDYVANRTLRWEVLPDGGLTEPFTFVGFIELYKRSGSSETYYTQYATPGEGLCGAGCSGQIYLDVPAGNYMVHWEGYAIRSSGVAGISPVLQIPITVY